MLRLRLSILVLFSILSVIGPVESGCLSNSVNRPKCHSSQSIVQELFNKIREGQVQTDEDFVFPPFFWKKSKGIYDSDVKLNLIGDPIVAMMRDDFKVFDNNMFATVWISIALIEAYKYSGAPKPSDQQIRLSVEAIGRHHDQNRPEPNSFLNFWPQAYNNSTSSWQSAPENLLAVFKLFDDLPWPAIEEVLKLFGLTAEDKYIQDILRLMPEELMAFHIPPDFDDTFVNLGLGALLTEFKTEFPESYKLWLAQNSGLNSLWDALKAYAYRPFSNDSNVNTIDSRTYFYIRGFLEEAKSAGNDVALVPTWIENIAEDVKMANRGVAMPFNINNVDATVSANVIFGLTAALTSGLANASLLTDPEILKIYANTSAMLVWEIKNDFIGRRDLALTYYPSVMEFYWFISRTYNLLERNVSTNATLPPALDTVRLTFGEVLRDHVTGVIINESRREGDDKLFFDDFLGDGDNTSTGEPLIRGEDRIFTTSMAVNTLVYTWMYQDSRTGQLRWIPDTPDDVVLTVQKATTWLVQNTLSGNYKPWNVFFSGSIKGLDTSPLCYPFNRLEFLNGTKIPLNTTTFNPNTVFGFQGVVSPGEYDQMLNMTHFGWKTPLTFTGYNIADDPFPFWSSEPYTYSTTMLAISHAQSLLTSTKSGNNHPITV